MYATIIRGCNRQLDDLSASLSRKDPAIRGLRHMLSHALLEATLSKTEQATLCIELCVASEHRRRPKGNSSGFGPAIDPFLDAQIEWLWMRFTASARMFDSVVYRTHVIVRHTASLCKETIGQGVRIQKAWSTCGRGYVHTRWGKRRRLTRSQNRRATRNERMAGQKLLSGRPGFIWLRKGIYTTSAAFESKQMRV